MHPIAKLLLGDETARALDLLSGSGERVDSADRADETVQAGRVRRSGAWCGTTPGTTGAVIGHGPRSR
jgi:hypothetical protein